MGRVLERQMDPVPLVIIPKQYGYNLERTIRNSSSCPYMGFFLVPPENLVSLRQPGKGQGISGYLGQGLYSCTSYHGFGSLIVFLCQSL